MVHDKKVLKAILSDAHDLIEDEESWCQKHLAEDADGKLTAPEGDAAERWCMVGAIQRSGLRRGASLDDIKAAAAIVQGHVGHTKLTAFNDSHTHEQVLEKFQSAMEVL